jgi:YVTN family beta-propeller protein
MAGRPLAFCHNLDNKVYCATIVGGYVAVIDAAADTIVDSIQVGKGPRALCYNSADDKVYCANNGSGTVTVIDGATDSVIATVGADSSPYALCYDPTNDKVYCASYDDRSVTVIDGATNAVCADIRVDDAPYAIVWNEAHNRVYVANMLGSSISVLRDSAGGVAETMNGERGMMSVEPTIVRGVLFLPKMGAVTSGTVPIFGPSLLDISGRTVLDLRPGANDVRALPAGVYFVRQTAGSRTAKVVIQR